MTQEYDVAVVGAGPGGCSAAIRLALAGHRIVLIDKARFPRDKVCGDYIGPRGLRELLELEVLVDTCQREQPLPLRGADIYVDDMLAASGEIPEVKGYESFGLAIARVALDDALFRRARAVGVETREGCTLLEFRADATGVELQTRGERGVEHLRARAIIGADGAQSRIARQVGLEIRDKDHTMVTRRSYVSGLNVDRACFYFAREFFPGFGWVFPLGNDRANIGVGMLKAALLEDSVDLHAFYARFESFVRSLQRGDGEIAIDAPRGWMIKIYGAHRKHSFERGLLVGEAAGFVDPISGEGIAHALESGRFAADTLGRALATHDFSARMLAEYDTRCAERWDLDFSLADYVVAAAKNRQMSDVWMRSLHLLSSLTNGDRGLAATFGGVMSGAVATREAFSMSTMARAWLRAVDEPRLQGTVTAGPKVWMDRAADWARVQDAVLSQVRSDPARFESWLLDLFARQRNLTKYWRDLLGVRSK